MTSTVALAGVVKRYGALEAVRGVTLDLAAGRSVALLGHNGAGKTTLIKLMLGLTRPTGGSVRVLGEDPLTPAGQRARLGIGYLPENVVFPGSLTGIEMLRFYAALKRRARSECKALLERVGLSAAAHKRIGTYSKGMRQRLGLAQALLGAPRLLLLDEPTTGLDPLLRQNFYSIVAELRDRGVTVLLASHVLTELEARVDHVVILHKGAVVASGPLASLRSMAQLPVRMRVAVSNGVAGELQAMLAPVATGLSCNGHMIELSCEASRKMEILRRIAGAPHVANIEIAEPTLDQIYARFLDARESAP